MADYSLPTPNPRPGPCIRWKKNGYEAYVRVGGRLRKQVCKRFRRDTPLKTMQDWQRRARAVLLSDNMILSPKPMPLFKKAPEGWCYLYVFKSGDYVKIGRTIDVKSRLQHAQSLHPTPIEFIVAVPTHASFETIVHKYFEPLRSQGEWYTLTEEIAGFVEWLQTGKNPLEWLWNISIHMGVKPTADDPCAERSTGTKPIRPAALAVLEARASRRQKRADALAAPVNSVQLPAELADTSQ